MKLVVQNNMQITVSGIAHPQYECLKSVRVVSHLTPEGEEESPSGDSGGMRVCKGLGFGVVDVEHLNI